MFCVIADNRTLSVKKTQYTIGVQMVIDINEIKENSPYQIDMIYDATLSNTLNLEDKLARIEIKCEVSKSGHLYLCKLKAKTLISARCDFCLMNTPFEIEFDVEETFAKPEQMENEEEINAITTAGMIDLTDVVLAGLYSQIPSQFICSESCKGLCTSCGTNLNINKCNCHENEKETDPRFDALKNIQWR